MNDPARRARLLRSALGRDGPIEPTETDWMRWVELAGTERVLPLLHNIASTTATDLSDEQRQMAAKLQLDLMATMVRFEHDLLDVAGQLSHGGVQCAVLKGAATAHLDYADPALRQFGDVDLLVSPEDLPRAIELLSVTGWRQTYPLPRYHERFTHAITLSNERRVQIDVHQRIAPRAVGELIPTRDLLAKAVTYEVAGQSLWALSEHDRLIHAALHTQASKGAFRRLSSAADVLLLAESNSQTAEAVLARAETWRVRPLVVQAITSTYSDALLSVPDAWVVAISRRTLHRDRLVEHAYLSEERRPAFEELAYLRVMRGWRNRGLYLRGYFSTDADYAKRNLRSGFVAQSRYLWSRLRSSSSS